MPTKYSSVNWLSSQQAQRLAISHGTPLFVYSRQYLGRRAKELAGLNLPYGYTPRYAVKANSHPEILALFDSLGLNFDASSGYEAETLLKQGIAGSKISLSGQEPPKNLAELLNQGMRFTATSMHQLELFTETAPQGTPMGLRVNPGLGSGQNNRLTTGGRGSSFGLWHEYLDQALSLAGRAGLSIQKLHVHIGSGADPAVWGKVMDTALALAKRMPGVTVLNIGGGYKIARMPDEPEADLTAIVSTFTKKLKNFAAATGRQLHLEIEPGTWLVGHAGILLAEIIDIVDTGADGFTFLRANTGMNDILRPTLYGAQHRITAINSAKEEAEYVVVGHNCETGDILTPASGDPERLQTRRLPKVQIGDLLVIHDVGAYCASMSAKGYNAFPSAQEVLI